MTNQSTVDNDKVTYTITRQQVCFDTNRELSDLEWERISAMMIGVLEYIYTIDILAPLTDEADFDGIVSDNPDSDWNRNLP